MLPCLPLLIATLAGAFSSLSVAVSFWTTGVLNVDPINGTGNKTCWTGKQPCRSLDLALKGAELSDNVTILLPAGVYNITSAYDFVGKIAFKLLVKQEKDVGLDYAMIFCRGSHTNDTAGLGFFNSSDIYFENVKFVGCGAVRNSSSRDQDDPGNFLKFQVALYFLFCSGVVMQNVSITQSNGTGLVLYGTVGQNRFTGCSFTKNMYTPGEKVKFGGGGGINVEFLFCVPGKISCFKKKNFIPSSDYSHNASYLFDKCNFSDNVAKTDKFISDSFVIPAGGHSVALGRGGGLSLLFKGVASAINVTIVNSQFLNNTADWGGGIEALFEDSASNNSVQVLSSHFINNHCSYEVFSYQGTGGGGARIHFAGLNQTVKHNRVVINNTEFQSNRAYFGGGVSFYTSLEAGVQNPTNSIVFSNSSWINNTARLGSAVDVTLWHEITDGVSLKPQFINCLFDSNSVEYTMLSGAPAGIGTLYTDSVDIVLAGTFKMFNNYGSGIASLDAGLDFMPGTTANLSSNTGRNGGAIALFGYAFIRVHNETALEFINNRAQFKGGAIYWESIGDHELISSRNCFIRYNDVFVDPLDWQTHLTFKNNFAGLSGKTIYATTLLTCLWGGNPFGTLNNLADQVFCWNNHSHIIWDYGNSSCSNNIATAGASFVNVSDKHTYSMSTIPGQYSALPVAMIDDKNNSLPVDSQIYSLEVEDKVIYLADDVKVPLKPAHQKQNLTMRVGTVQPRVLTAEVMVTFDPCPPGYYLNHSSYLCEFGKFPFIHTNGPFASKIQRGCWIGYNGVTKSTLVSGHCIYRESTPSVDFQFLPLPQDPKQIDDKLCKPLNRTGVLCGKCINGFAPAVNSKFFHCVQCASGIQYYSWILYILTEYVPITILLIIVILFNISVTSGPGNAFIFFAQIISSTFAVNGDGILNYQSVTSAAWTIEQVYTSLYDIWNLNFFDFLQGWQFCLSPHLNSLQMRVLEYLTAVYPLILLGIILAVVVLNERQNKVVVWMLKPLHRLLARFRRRWNFKRSIIDAFATFLVLSFTKFAIIAAYTTYPEPMFDENGTVAYRACYVYGEYAFFSKEYAPYLAVSVIISFVVCILMPLVLLVYSLKPVYSCFTRLKLSFLLPGPRFQLFLNVFYNCYKDGTNGTHDLRFFASVYFGIRVLIVLLYPFAPTWVVQYILQQIVCTIGVLLFAILQPYKNRFYNCLDATAFTLLAVINIISFYSRYLGAVGEPPSSLGYWVQVILIFLPLVYMSCFLVAYFGKANKDWLKWLFWRVCCCGRKKKFSILSNELEQSFGSFMDETIAAGEYRSSINYYGPIARIEPEEEIVSREEVLHTSVQLDTNTDTELENKGSPLQDVATCTTENYGSVPLSQPKKAS